MTNTLTLTCTQCGSRLVVPVEIGSFACSQCGTEFTVRRSGGIAALVPVLGSEGPAPKRRNAAAPGESIRQLEQELKDLRQAAEGILKTAESRQGSRTTMIILGLLVGLGGLFAFFVVDFIVGVLIMAVGAIMVFLGNGVAQSAMRDLAVHMPPLMAQIKSKEAELERLRKIRAD